jgi:hypothetical protein
MRGPDPGREGGPLRIERGPASSRPGPPTVEVIPTGSGSEADDGSLGCGQASAGLVLVVSRFGERRKTQGDEPSIGRMPKRVRLVRSAVRSAESAVTRGLGRFVSSPVVSEHPSCGSSEIDFAVTRTGPHPANTFAAADWQVAWVGLSGDRTNVGPSNRREPRRTFDADARNDPVAARNSVPGPWDGAARAAPETGTSGVSARHRPRPSTRRDTNRPTASRRRPKRTERSGSTGLR